MTATDYDFSVTRTQILERALRQVGALALGETMSADQEAQANLILNTVVKSWQARRTFLWTISTFTQALSASVGSYALPTDPPIVSLDQGFLRDSSNDDTPLTRLSLSEFRQISDKTSTGDPTHYSSDGTNLLIWPSPLASAVWTFYGVGVSRLKDWDTAGSVGEFPAKWINALVYAVASDLAAEYGLPIGERTALKGEAESNFRTARNGSEDSTDMCFTKGAF